MHGRTRRTVVRLAGFAMTMNAALAFQCGESHKLLPNDGYTWQRFCNAAAVDGELAVVAAHTDDGQASLTGAVYVFDTTTGAQTRKLVAEDGHTGDMLGVSVGVSGTLVIAGSERHDQLVLDAGAAYVFDAVGGTQVAKLLANDRDPDDRFGTSVAISGARAVVGAPRDDENGLDTGAVYLFEEGPSGWSQRAKIVASDGVPLDWFGNRVALDGTTLVVATERVNDMGVGCGAAYVFDLTTGQQTAKLYASDVAPHLRFGSSVAVDGTTAIVGAEYSDAAYLFDLTTGVELARVQAPQYPTNIRFGVSVSISGARALVGAMDDDTGGNDNAGKVHLYDAGTGSFLGTLLPSDLAPGDGFGYAVAIDGATALGGGIGDDDQGEVSGSAYLFDVSLPASAAYCFGDGGGTPCPCGNDGQAGHGCANSVFPEGARLFGLGDACVAAEGFTLAVESSRPSQPGLFFQGDEAIDGGSGAPFGDGLRCAGTGMVKLEVAFASGAGTAMTMVSLAATGGVSPGDVKRYQWWYRDPFTGPCGSGHNGSNGLEVAWGP